MNEVRAIFRSMPAPRPVVADLVYHPPLLNGTPDFWTVRLYRDNLRTFSGEDQQVIAKWVFDVILACREAHPRVSHEVFEREGDHG